MKGFLSVREAAEYLGVDYKTIYRLVTSGSLPAGKIGGIYRIRSSDLEEYFQSQIAHLQQPRDVDLLGDLARADRNIVMGDTRTQTCGRCKRLIRTKGMIGGTCEEPLCDEILCLNCWSNVSDRHCRQHAARRESESGRRLEVATPGGPSVIVSAAEARKRELTYIGRFDQKMHELNYVHNPLDGTQYSLKPRDCLHRQDVELQASTGRIRRAHTSNGGLVLPSSLKSTYHFQNARVSRGNGGVGVFVIEAVVLAHLETYLDHGFDTFPAKLDELLRLLESRIDAAKASEALWIVGIGSPTGWAQEAETAIAGDESSRAFSSLYVSPCLVDLNSDRLVFNALDRRLLPFIDLFGGEFPEESLQRAEAYVRDTLVAREGLTVSEVSEATGLAAAAVANVFGKLEREGTYALDHIGKLGLVISRK